MEKRVRPSGAPRHAACGDTTPTHWKSMPAQLVKSSVNKRLSHFVSPWTNVLKRSGSLGSGWRSRASIAAAAALSCNLYVWLDVD